MQTPLSCHGPVANYSQTRSEFADHQQIRGPAVGQVTTLLEHGTGGTWRTEAAVRKSVASPSSSDGLDRPKRIKMQKL